MLSAFPKVSNLNFDYLGLHIFICMFTKLTIMHILFVAGIRMSKEGGVTYNFSESDECGDTDGSSSAGWFFGYPFLTKLL